MKLVLITIGSVEDGCKLVPDILGSDVGKVACNVPVVVVKTISKVAIFLAELAISLSERLYFELVDKDKNAAFAGGRDNSIYRNVITNHGNIIQIFYAAQQLKTMLGEVSDVVKETNGALENDDRRRLQLKDCVNTTSADGFLPQCSKVSCEDPAKLCDGSPNFKYIAFLQLGQFVRTFCLVCC